MGGKTSTTTQATSQSIPSDVLARYNSVNARAAQAATQPFTQYSPDPNAFVAPLTSTQQAGISNINQAQNIPGAFFQAATPLAFSGAESVNPGAIDGGTINQYMSPYLSTVLNTTSGLIDRQNAQQSNQLRSDAVRSGAFGGDRSGIAQANLAREQSLGAGKTYADILNQGYGQALNTAQQQQGVSLGADQANRAARASAGQQIAGLGVGAQQAALTGGQAQLGAGTAEQQTLQAGLSALYNQFLQQQGYPFQVAQFESNIALGTGALSGSTTAGSTTQPSSFLSDERMKDNIEPIGKTFDGQDIVKYNYKGSPSKQIGLIAQDVERHHPDAVGVSGGMMTVDYDRATQESAARGRESEGGGVVPSRAGEGYAEGGAATGTKLDQLLRMLTPGRRTDPYNSGGLYGQTTPAEGPYGVYTARGNARMQPTDGYRQPQLRPYNYVPEAVAKAPQFADGGGVGGGYASGGSPYDIDAILARQRAMYPGVGGGGGGAPAGLGIPTQRPDKVQRLEAPQLQRPGAPEKSGFGQAMSGMRDMTQTGESVQKAYDFGKKAYSGIKEFFDYIPTSTGGYGNDIGIGGWGSFADGGGVAGRHGYATDGMVEDAVIPPPDDGYGLDEYARRKSDEEAAARSPSSAAPAAVVPEGNTRTGVSPPSSAALAAVVPEGNTRTGVSPPPYAGDFNTDSSSNVAPLAGETNIATTGVAGPSKITPSSSSSSDRIDEANRRQKALEDRINKMPERTGPYSQTERLVIPFLSALGALGASPSRYLGAAILQGVGSGADAYANIQQKQTQLGNELTQADTDRLRVEAEAAGMPLKAEESENVRREQDIQKLKIGLDSLKFFNEGLVKVYDQQTGALNYRGPDQKIYTPEQIGQRNQQIAKEFGITGLFNPSSTAATEPATNAPSPLSGAQGRVPTVSTDVPEIEKSILNPMDRPSYLMQESNRLRRVAEGQQNAGDPAAANSNIARARELEERALNIQEGRIIVRDTSGAPISYYAVTQQQLRADVEAIPAAADKAATFIQREGDARNNFDNLKKIFSSLGSARIVERADELINLAESLPVIGDILRNSGNLAEIRGLIAAGQKESAVAAMQTVISSALSKAPATSIGIAMQSVVDPDLPPDARYARYIDARAEFEKAAKFNRDYANAGNPRPFEFTKQWIERPENSTPQFKNAILNETPFFKDMTPAAIIRYGNFKNPGDAYTALIAGRFGDPKDNSNINKAEEIDRALAPRGKP